MTAFTAASIVLCAVRAPPACERNARTCAGSDRARTGRPARSSRRGSRIEPSRDLRFGYVLCGGSGRPHRTTARTAVRRMSSSSYPHNHPVCNRGGYALYCSNRIEDTSRVHPADCPSGQWERTVNPSAYAYVGSNPTSATQYGPGLRTGAVCIPGVVRPGRSYEGRAQWSCRSCGSVVLTVSSVGARKMRLHATTSRFCTHGECV